MHHARNAEHEREKVARDSKANAVAIDEHVGGMISQEPERLGVEEEEVSGRDGQKSDDVHREEPARKRNRRRSQHRAVNRRKDEADVQNRREQKGDGGKDDRFRSVDDETDVANVFGRVVGGGEDREGARAAPEEEPVQDAEGNRGEERGVLASGERGASGDERGKRGEGKQSDDDALAAHGDLREFEDDPSDVDQRPDRKKQHQQGRVEQHDKGGRRVPDLADVAEIKSEPNEQDRADEQSDGRAAEVHHVGEVREGDADGGDDGDGEAAEGGDERQQRDDSERKNAVVVEGSSGEEFDVSFENCCC